MKNGRIVVKLDEDTDVNGAEVEAQEAQEYARSVWITTQGTTYHSEKRVLAV